VLDGLMLFLPVKIFENVRKQLGYEWVGTNQRQVELFLPASLLLISQGTGYYSLKPKKASHFSFFNRAGCQ
jgi:hypothetical protein